MNDIYLYAQTIVEVVGSISRSYCYCSFYCFCCCCCGNGVGGVIFSFSLSSSTSMLLDYRKVRCGYELCRGWLKTEEDEGELI